MSSRHCCLSTFDDSHLRCRSVHCLCRSTICSRRSQQSSTMNRCATRSWRIPRRAGRPLSLQTAICNALQAMCLSTLHSCSQSGGHRQTRMASAVPGSIWQGGVFLFKALTNLKEGFAATRFACCIDTNTVPSCFNTYGMTALTGRVQPTQTALLLQHKPLCIHKKSGVPK